ncbi:MAG TPA: hypothetical protein VMS17_12670, partial [Gemmataceae bacterium]|nr:hypothetical protein [Gemmataceae bacterium]
MTTQRLAFFAVLTALAASGGLHSGLACAADEPKPKVDLQPLAAQARRVADALELLGAPLSAEERKALADARDADAIQAVLDKHCLFAVHLRPLKESGATVPVEPVVAESGPAKPELAEQGWRAYLV